LLHPDCNHTPTRLGFPSFRTTQGVDIYLANNTNNLDVFW